ncbi:Mss4-like protein [Phycomyces blakesleeanus]|uniref:Mss4-like protein n=1 Tax=Phycomyces blakesleeanus TaxID=4837 RepID=A0ABR3B9S2_PHYBL
MYIHMCMCMYMYMCIWSPLSRDFFLFLFFIHSFSFYFIFWYPTKLSFPEQNLGLDIAQGTETRPEETHFWKLKDMMDFENIGFSKTVGTIKYLSCADCDIGPLGYHDTAVEPKEYLVSIRRARYRFS